MVITLIKTVDMVYIIVHSRSYTVTKLWEILNWGSHNYIPQLSACDERMITAKCVKYQCCWQSIYQSAYNFD